MFNFSPTTWIAVACIAGGIFLAGLSAGSIWATNSAAATAVKLANEVEEERRTAQTDLNAANQINRSMEIAHAQEVANIRAEFAAENASEKAADNLTITNLRSGNDKLRFQVKTCSTGPRQTGPAALGVDEVVYAELEGEAASRVWNIAADGDEAIRTLTDLQKWAASAVKLCSGATTNVNTH